ncbi:hypothetical protein H4S06_005337, partial [Coemansia sp. BCRC 34490]
RTMDTPTATIRSTTIHRGNRWMVVLWHEVRETARLKGSIWSRLFLQPPVVTVAVAILANTASSRSSSTSLITSSRRNRPLAWSPGGF